MVCAILANMMDGRSTFLQTLIGLICYGQGLRDKGMKFLNPFGVSCSVFHVRKHGSFWANARKAIAEISPVAFWGATFDNLDFRLKHAKKLTCGGHLNTMFHLLTNIIQNNFKFCIQLYC